MSILRFSFFTVWFFFIITFFFTFEIAILEPELVVVLSFFLFFIGSYYFVNSSINQQFNSLFLYQWFVYVKDLFVEFIYNFLIVLFLNVKKFYVYLQNYSLLFFNFLNKLNYFSIFGSYKNNKLLFFYLKLMVNMNKMLVSMIFSSYTIYFFFSKFQSLFLCFNDLHNTSLNTFLRKILLKRYSLYCFCSHFFVNQALTSRFFIKSGGNKDIVHLGSVITDLSPFSISLNSFALKSGYFFSFFSSFKKQLKIFNSFALAKNYNNLQKEIYLLKNICENYLTIDLSGLTQLKLDYFSPKNKYFTSLLLLYFLKKYNNFTVHNSVLHIYGAKSKFNVYFLNSINYLYYHTCLLSILQRCNF